MPPLSAFSRTAVSIAVAQALALQCAQAATITVDSALDDGSACTLRDAFSSINAGSDLLNDCVVSGTFGTSDTINFDSSLVNQTVSLTQGMLFFNANANINLTINGLGSNRLAISGGQTQTIFYISDSVLTLNDVTISEGFGSVDGGAIRSRSSALNINNTDLTANTAGAKGGSIFATESTVSLSNTRVTGNSASDGAGLYLRNSTLIGSNCTISENSASVGAGLFLSNSTLNASNCTISGNSASNNGGGIWAPSNNIISLDSSTIADNSATTKGGGIYAAFGTSVDLTNSTISSNSAAQGSGLYSFNSYVNLINSTVVANSSTIRGGLTLIAGTATLRNSIVSGNESVFGNGFEIYSLSSPSTIITASNNIFGDSKVTSGIAFSNFTPDDSNLLATSDSVDARRLTDIIGPLLSNRGFTRTHALNPNSLAIDRADNSSCPLNDQRGEARNDGSCDIGAVEYIQGMDAATIEVNSAYDDGSGCTLREAVQTINYGGSPVNGCVVNGSLGIFDTVTFAPSLNDASISLTQGRALYAFEVPYLNINGPRQGSLEINVDSSGGNNSRIFYFRNANVVIQDVTLTGGNPSPVGGGAIRMRSSELTLSRSTLSANTAITGGGIYSVDSKIALLNSTVSGNTARTSSGGGLRIIDSEALIVNSTISGNSTADVGGGINGTGTNTVVIENSTISGNSAGFSGAGIQFDSGPISINNTTIALNTAGFTTGGLYTRSSASITLLNSLFVGNRSDSAAEFRFNGASIYGAHNLFGDSGNTNFQAFEGVSPSSVGAQAATSDSDTPRTVESMIAPLSVNNGVTKTHPLRPNSLAIGIGGPNDVFSRRCAINDQRGFARDDGACDVGAVEFNEILDKPTVIVNSEADDDVGCTLREAIRTLNTLTPVISDCDLDGFPGIGGTIEFSPSLNNRTITLTQSEEILVDFPGLELTINGSGQDNFEINANNNGRAFYFRDSVVELNNLTISHGNSEADGGAILVDGSEVTLNNVTLHSNTARSGGALSASSSKVNLNNSLLTSNSAILTGFGGSGGAINSISSDIKLVDTTLTDNSADFRGGALSAFNGGNITIDSSLLSSNTARSGGAISSLLEVSLSINSSDITGNYATINGGGVWVRLDDISVQDSTFSQNQAGQKGGALWLFAETDDPYAFSTMVGNTLTNNIAVNGDGGAVYVNGGALDSQNNRFSHNSAPIGGAVSLIGARVYMGADRFYNNTATTLGGAIFSTDGITGITNSVLSANSAGDSGGAVLTSGENPLFVLNSTLSSNSATASGGAIAVFGEGGITHTLLIENSTLNLNESGFSGGAIALIGSRSSEIRNSTLSANKAVGNGGAIYARRVSANKIYDSTLYGNSAAEGGGIYTNDSDIDVEDSLIIGNSATVGAELAASGPRGIGGIDVRSYNLIGDSTKLTSEALFNVPIRDDSTSLFATSDGTHPTSLSDIVAPLANNGGRTQTHALVDQSPALDSARMFFSCLEGSENQSKDQRGELRDDGACDIGAFEFKESDIPEEETFFVVPLPNGKSVIFVL